MLSRNPTLIPSLCSSCSSGRDLNAGRCRLIDGIGRLLGSFTTFTLLCLREEGGEPSGVDEVTGSTEAGDEEEVEEDAAGVLAILFDEMARTPTSEDQRY